MNALREGVPVEAVNPVDDGGDTDLAVEHHLLGQLGTRGVDDFREVPGEVFAAARTDVDLVAVTKDQRAKAIPLGFV